MSYGKLQLLLLGLLLDILGQRVAFSEVLFNCDGSQAYPCLVQESLNSVNPVMNLRDIRLIRNYYSGDISGIDSLNLSASAMPNAVGWGEVKNYIEQQAPAMPQKIIVVDLRQESHGYLNGMAINLTTAHNWININKTNEEIKLAEKNWLFFLKSQMMVSGVLTPQQFETHDYLQGRSIEIHTIQDEEEAVKEKGLDYVRFYVSDHRAPVDNEVDRFVEFYKHLEANTWLHIHCRGGKGRSTSFLALVDMLNNADKVSFEEILARQAAIPPFYNLGLIVRSDPELTPFYIERLQFLRQFYYYSQASIHGYKGTWSEWKNSREVALGHDIFQWGYDKSFYLK
ncbi:hypothetical protein [Legionella brunensis]|uniref:Tyrosine phosphatase II superfamily transporter protein n=1 Tax=Legionella brunensis TaxID=29422 RepID=A0A0W0STX9_9GAMM|nr:hypothetical protein [Legionella brunensis]KTC86669.1 tyrosine phosphatase II superfamily transporter protein [Legionella brunensis]